MCDSYHDIYSLYIYNQTKTVFKKKKKLKNKKHLILII